MNFEKNNIPVGLAPKLEASKETFPAVEVKNHVLYVNPDIDFPFDMKVGQATNLGLFVTDQVQAGQKSRDVEVKIHHGRTALLGRIVFGGRGGGTEKELYRDVDIKGLGYIETGLPELNRSPTASVKDVKIQHQNPEKAWGILNSEDAFRDKDCTEMFREYGIRTHGVIAIIALEEIIHQGKKISITEAKSLGLIPENSDPVLEVRAFGTHARLKDVHFDSFTELSLDTTSRAKRNLLVEDARLLLAQELGVDPEDFGAKQHYRWLAKTVGKSLGLMHKHGWIHSYLREGHNITLDGRIIDFESAKYVGPESAQNFQDEFNAAFVSLQTFLSASELRYPMHRDLVEEILKEFEDSYGENKSN